MVYHEDWCEVWTSERCVCDSGVYEYFSPTRMPTAAELNFALKGKTLNEIISSVPTGKPMTTHQETPSGGNLLPLPAFESPVLKRIREEQAILNRHKTKVENHVKTVVEEIFADKATIKEKDLMSKLAEPPGTSDEEHLHVYFVNELVQAGVLTRNVFTGMISYI